MQKLIAEVAKRLRGGVLPDRYIVLDTETSGTSIEQDSILQYGYCIVAERKKVDAHAILLNRGDIYINPGAFDAHGLTAEHCKANGFDPAEAVRLILDTLQAWRDSGGLFVGHNIWNFDACRIESDFRKFGSTFKFMGDDTIDTGMLVKASRLSVFPHSNETLEMFYRRVNGVRAKGVYWSLDRYCYETYQLGSTGIDKELAHDAGVDCELTHLLLEKLRILGAAV